MWVSFKLENMTQGISQLIKYIQMYNCYVILEIRWLHSYDCISYDYGNSLCSAVDETSGKT